MMEKAYLYLFIHCVILSHVIVANFLEENNHGESSEHLIRQKRVINRGPGAEMPLLNGDVPYVANLKRNHFMHCIATILSHHTAITAARCVEEPDISVYTVHSGASYAYRGKEHNVTEKKFHGHNPFREHTFLTGIALITVNPPFVFSHSTGKIGLHSGPVLPDMQGIVAGWGSRIGRGRVESQYTRRLRLISVPVMNHRECVNIYRQHFQITDEEICTYHQQKLCGDTDVGAPLVVDDELVGVHLGEIYTVGVCPIKPDVFVFVQHLNYGPWIMRNI